MPDPQPHHPPGPTDPGYGQFDLWLDTAGADDGRARELAALLELRARHPEQHPRPPQPARRERPLPRPSQPDHPHPPQPPQVHH